MSDETDWLEEIRSAVDEMIEAGGGLIVVDGGIQAFWRAVRWHPRIMAGCPESEFKRHPPLSRLGLKTATKGRKLAIYFSNTPLSAVYAALEAAVAKCDNHKASSHQGALQTA